MRLSSYSCFRVALQKSQVMTSFRPPPMFFPGGATAHQGFHMLTFGPIRLERLLTPVLVDPTQCNEYASAA